MENENYIGEEDEFHGKDPAEEEVRKKEKMAEEGKCFNKERIKDLKDAWIQYSLEWDSSKEAIPKELYQIIEELIFRLEE